jgi:hypothetical protein
VPTKIKLFEKRKEKKKSLEVVSNNLMPRKIWCKLFLPPCPTQKLAPISELH